MKQRLTPPQITGENRRSDTSWMELLQRAFDGVFPSEQRLEEFLDRWERLP